MKMAMTRKRLPRSRRKRILPQQVAPLRLEAAVELLIEKGTLSEKKLAQRQFELLTKPQGAAP